MAPTTPTIHDPALSHNPAAAVPQQPPQQQPPIMLPADLSSLQGLGSEQLMTLLRNLPGVLGKFNEGKEDAAQTLSNLSAQQPPFPPGAFPPHPGGLPGINDPGPSSHPRGPPNLGQLSAVAMSASPAASAPQPPQIPGQPEASEEERRAAAVVAAAAAAAQVGAASEVKPTAPSPTATRGRGGRSATMGSDEWTRQRKDNHKEVERRRRGNINEGINELGRIVPNGSGEKAKGAILSRAVQYIHHLKENEARNIEKWTLEKLLMDQAMGDLQTQLEEMKKMWEAEREGRARAEAELEALRGAMAAVSSTSTSQQAQPVHARSGSLKRDAAEVTTDADKDGKKQRIE
ncbi:hypothetical protein C0995_011691 [Termitomyces sp. Mi166|nr:hypothetical protein C0995_011691 [Termitomyces sp. Mi166\